MIIKRLNGRTSALVQLEFKVAESTGSVTQNSPVAIHASGSSIDGISGGQPSATNQFIGISNKTVAINGYGLANAFGYVASCKISGEGTSITITAGDALIPVAGTDLGMSSVGGATAGWANQPCAIALQTLDAVSADPQYMKVFVRALR